MVRRDERTGEPIRRSLNESTRKEAEETEYILRRRGPSDSDTRPVGRGGGAAEPEETHTRILGFGSGGETGAGKARAGAVTGWLVIWSGPGKGASHTLGFGRNLVGRGAGCDVSIDHGDTSISTKGDVTILFDRKNGHFFIKSMEGRNVVYLDGAPLISHEKLKDGSTIEIGETQLVFVAFCKPDRHWPE